ncbi:MAG TPA: polysaccharide deacetylase family protein [Allosphingosinicella sp.]|nr:polysaccharide deacetylase family protein [Allosphingosinicella sp.]
MTIPRKQDRRRRVARWALTVAAGALGGAFLWSLVGGAAGAVMAAASVAAALAAGHRLMIAPPGVPVLTYHSVSPDPSWLPWSREISVHPKTFERHLRTLRKMGCNVIPTVDFVALRRAGRTVPPNSVMLHFDDGYRDNWLYAVPLLRRERMPATFFVSLDFIAPADMPAPPDPADSAGYMSWAEIAAIEADPLFDVQSHGIDHGRVAISDRVVGKVTAANWRKLAWVQWARMEGPKHDWYRAEAPPAAPIGTPVPESEGALAAPEFVNGRREGEQQFRGRIAAQLGRCREVFSDRLGHPPRLFCWPENRACAAGREVAAQTGFEATTAGTGRNTADEPPAVLSRIHIGDRALGFRCGPFEALRLRAAVRLFQGNLYWYLVTAPMDLARRLVMGLRARFGSHFA